jgi:hypothetical protein
MDNPYRKHRVGHMSASSFNLAKADMTLWGIQYLCGVRGSMSVHAARGIGSEDGTIFGLKNPEASIEECIEIAVRTFNEKTALSAQGGDARDKQRDVMQGYKTSRSEYPGTVRVAVEALRPLGIPTGHGDKITTTIEGCPVPVIGYKDFSYDSHGFSVDLKTTERMPSSISPDHRAQLAIYAHASNNQTQRVAYCTPKEATIYELSPADAKLALDEVSHVARVLGERLDAADTPEDFVRAQVPDFTGFRWHDDARAKAAEILGF